MEDTTKESEALLNGAGKEVIEEKSDGVSKEEFAALVEKLEGTTKSIETLKKENDSLKGELLSPEYIAALNARDGSAGGFDTKTTQLPQGQQAAVDIDSMSRQEFAKYVTDTIITSVGPQLDQRFQKIEEGSQLLAAKSELKNTREGHEDFKEYEHDVYNLIRSNPSYTYEDAYKIAKQDRIDVKSREEQETASRAAQEKPGGAGRAATSPESFGNAAEANNDAWEKIMGNSDKL